MARPGEAPQCALVSTLVPPRPHQPATERATPSQGAPAPVHSCASGLDYPGIGPQHAWLKHSGRVQYESATDAEVSRTR